MCLAVMCMWHVYLEKSDNTCMFVSRQGRKLHKLMDSLKHFFLSSVAEKTKTWIDERIEHFLQSVGHQSLRQQ